MIVLRAADIFFLRPDFTLVFLDPFPKAFDSIRTSNSAVAAVKFETFPSIGGQIVIP